MRILGIDPGIRNVGVAWVEADGPHAVNAGDWCMIETDAGLPLAQRLEEIGKDIDTLLDDIRPGLAVVERLFFAVNAKSALEVAQARGAILARIAARNIAVLEPAPLELKRAITGDGRADKRQVQDMLMRCLRLPAIPRPVDAADALALAYFGALQPTLTQA